MIKTDFNKGWLFCREGEKEYIATDVPHDAMLREPRTDDSEGGTNTGWFAGCDYEYIKEFDVSSDIADRELILEFEGVYRNAEVYVNGEKAAFHPYGYGNFYVNITDKVKEGKNTVLVKAKNADQPNSRWYTGAGIYRPVWLYVLPKKHICIDGVKVRTLSYAERRIEVAVGTTDGGSLSISVSDGNSELYSLEAETDGAFRTEITLPCAELWSPEHCKLYDLTVRFGQDEQTVRFGIREVTCPAREGLKINGERIVLNGACIHHDNGLIGAAAVIGLFFMFVKRALQLAMRCETLFMSLVAVGIAGHVGLQAFLNIAVVTATIPNTGVTLPFFSYGGSALVVLLCESGILLSVTKNKTKSERERQV